MCIRAHHFVPIDIRIEDFSDKGIYHRIERDILMRIVDLRKEDQNEGVGQAEAKPSRGNPEDARENKLDSLHHSLPLGQPIKIERRARPDKICSGQPNSLN
jgi:hypothetical protein